MRKTLLGLAAAAAFAPLSAPATDGYFAHGYGMKGKGRGGASTAMTDDAFGGAVNPATMAFAGERLDLGLDWFRPQRSAKREGSAGGTGFLDASVEGNESENFFIPEFGYNTMLRPDLSLGVTVYANGGMNTDYPGNGLDQGVCMGGAPNGVPANILCGSGNLGVDLAQLIIAPTLAWKFHPSHSVGISPLIGYQRFKAYGLQPFAAISSDPANLTNNGYDDAWGFGARVGYFGRITPQFAVGVGYSTKIAMSEFDKYKGLFAEQGDFDIPENYNLGVAFKATPKLTIAADWQRILYNKVRSVGNPSNVPGVGDAALGASSSSIGFGWQNVDAWKIGVEYQWSSSLTLRAGYNKSDNPITARDVTFNILAPGVIEEHVTLGFTYNLSKTTELTVAYMHAFENSVSGPANNPNFPVGGTETLRMSEDSLGIALGWKF
jgi:long-chain fatty acid transport protein